MSIPPAGNTGLNKGILLVFGLCGLLLLAGLTLAIYFQFKGSPTGTATASTKLAIQTTEIETKPALPLIVPTLSETNPARVEPLKSLATDSPTPLVLTPSLVPTASPEPTRPPFFGKIAFISDRDGHFSMYLADLDNLEGAKAVPFPQEYDDVFDPTFCGKYLAFEVQKRAAYGQWIYWWDSQTNSIAQIDLPATAGLVGAPKCSPDGRYLAYTDLAKRPWKLVVVDLAGQKVVFENASGSLAGFAAWASNSLDLFDMTFSGNTYKIQQALNFSAITEVELAASDRGPISSSYYPAISPDGASLAFTCGVGGEFFLCVTNPISSHAHILDTISGVKYKGFTLPFGTPAWSADGEWIYYSTKEGGNLDIFRIRPDGTGRENLTLDWASNEIQPTIAW